MGAQDRVEQSRQPKVQRAPKSLAHQPSVHVARSPKAADLKSMVRTPQTIITLQTSVGNWAVQRQLLPPISDSSKDATSAAQSNAHHGSSSALDSDTDAEGNGVTTLGRKQYLSVVPADLLWHKGKAQALPPNPKAAYATLRAHCGKIRDEQFALANSMRGDMKYWFAKIYYYVTRHELIQIDAQAYQYPLMKMQEVIAFHDTYRQNLDRWREGNKDKVEGNWRAAFTAAESAEAIYKTKALEIMTALVPSMEAHIRFDLPRAIAFCFERYYSEIPGLTLNDFYKDFQAMAPVFESAKAELQPEIDQATHWFPEVGVGLDPTNWHWAQSIGFPFIFLTSLERDHTWDKTIDIVSGHKRGISDQRQMQERLRANSRVRHPNSSASDFDVAGQNITNYEWDKQPRGSR